MGNNCLNTYDEIIEKFISWTQTSCDVKSAYVIGSRARLDNPADEYSDLDLVLITINSEHYLTSTLWLESIGNYWASFIEDTVGGGKERRVMFENAMDVDFLIFSEMEFTQGIKGSDVQSLFARGYRVLFDSDDLARALPQIPAERKLYLPPTFGEFINLANDFFYHSVWSAKKLLRGELWAAKSCVDCYLKGHLLNMIECHTHVKNGWDYDTWHNGRFFDTWTEQRVKEGIQSTFANYSRKDIGRALLATMDLFRLLAIEVSEDMDFEYPFDADERTTAWVRKSLIG